MSKRILKGTSLSVQTFLMETSLHFFAKQIAGTKILKKYNRGFCFKMSLWSLIRNSGNLQGAWKFLGHFKRHFVLHTQQIHSNFLKKNLAN